MHLVLLRNLKNVSIFHQFSKLPIQNTKQKFLKDLESFLGPDHVQTSESELSKIEFGPNFRRLKPKFFPTIHFQSQLTCA